LGGSRCAKWRHYLNIVIVFLISGIWHGAAFTFIIWGAVHAAYQVIGSLTIKPRNALLSKMRLSPDSGVVKLVRRGVTFILVCLAWVCFRANSVPDMLMIFREIFTGFGGVDVFKSLESLDMNLVAVLTTVFSVYVMSALDKHMSGMAGCYRKGVSGVAERSAWYITVCWCICIAWMILLAAGEVSSFIYFQF
jgi:D-alanyl-lipoteichoic acid acyltransferase DltB (MBOAT superfamily)